LSQGAAPNLPQAWLLSPAERGNSATAIDAEHADRLGAMVGSANLNRRSWTHNRGHPAGSGSIGWSWPGP
jgi:hypothetical protein